MDKTLETDPSKPRIGDLVESFKRCTPSAGSWDRLTDNEEARFNVWDGQSPDCKKHGSSDSPAKPWEGASDQRVFLADEICNDDVAACITAFWQSLVQTDGVGLEDAGSAVVSKQILSWYIRHAQAEDLDREVELSAQYWRTYGWTMLHVTWQREVGLRQVEMTTDQLTNIAPDLVEAIADPSREGEAVARVQEIFSVWAQSQAGTILEDAVEMPTSEARSAVRELREDRKTDVAIPYVCRNEPKIIALRPWYDVFLPNDFGDVQRGTVIVRWYFTEQELRAKVKTDDWDEEWVEQALKTKGSSSSWAEGQAAMDVIEKWTPETVAGSELIEVLFAYTRRIDKRGMPGIYLTIFSAHFSKGETGDQELCALHGLSDYSHGKSPFVALVREWISRAITTSRGVPEVAYPYQRLAKVQQDALVDRTSLTTLPPRLVTPRLATEVRNVEFGPAATIPIHRGEEIRFMDVPGMDRVAEEILRYTDEKVDTYFGRLSKDVPPQRSVARMQAMVTKFLRAWTAAFRQEWALIQQYCPPEEWERITTTPKPEFQPAEIGRNYDVVLAMDVRDLDMEFVFKKLQAISQFVVPEDSAGVIDKVQLINLKLAAIDPRLAKQLVVPAAQANQKLFEQVNLELASMYLGNPPKLVENDPTASRQLQFATQIVQNNPKYQQELTQDGGRFAEAMKVWAENRMQSVTQEENKTIGRLGTKPLEMR